MICVTGLKPETRVQIRKLVSANGGRYSADLTRHCTHLLAEAPSGDKYRYASAWRIPVVSTDWLLDTVNQQAYQDVSRYVIDPHASHLTAAPLTASNALGGHHVHSLRPLLPPVPHHHHRLVPRASVPLSPSPSDSIITSSPPVLRRGKPLAAEHAPAALAQLTALYRTLADICGRVGQLAACPSADQRLQLGRELARVTALIDHITAAVFIPDTACALLLSASTGSTPAFRHACIR